MIEHVSVSSLKLHAYSPKKWVLEYLEGLRPPPTKHLEFGSLVHSAIEDLYVGKSVEGEHKGFFEQWKGDNEHWFKLPDWKIENEFKVWLDLELPLFKGRIDMWRMEKNEQVFQIHVVDHKTVTSGYELSASALKKDWQLSLYCVALNPYILKEKDARIKAAAVSHNQLFKSREFDLIGYDLVTAELTAGDILRNIEEIKEEARKVLQTISTYDKLGFEAVDLGQAKQKYYGKPDLHWPVLSGKVSLEEFKKTWRKIDEV